jgi:hypothetical protein
MKKLTKKIILGVLSCLLFLSCVGMIACGDKTGQLPVYPDSVECGKYFKVPEMIGDDVKVQVVSPSKKKVSLSKGGFQMTEVGKYTINYTYGDNNKSITVNCT